jgi:hypothetical protein
VIEPGANGSGGGGVRHVAITAAEADYLAAVEKLDQLRKLAAQTATRIAKTEVAVAALRRAADLGPSAGKRARSGVTGRVRAVLPATRREVYAALGVETPTERQRIKQILLNLRYTGEVVLDESVDPPIFRLTGNRPGPRRTDRTAA